MLSSYGMKFQITQDPNSAADIYKNTSCNNFLLMYFAEFSAPED